MTTAPIIVWFRKDLRLADNPALHAAAATGRRVVPLFILDESTGPALGSASKWWLHKSLEALGAPMVLRRGNPQKILANLIAETGAKSLFWNRLYEPEAIARDTAIKAALQDQNIDVQSFAGRYLAEPWMLKTKTGTMLKVFTPYWRALLAHFEAHPLADPLPAADATWASATSDDLADWDLLPTRPNWAGGLEDMWHPGEVGAWARFDTFAGDGSITEYKEDRNRPDRPGVSYLSPHLHWGEISVRQLWHAVKFSQDKTGENDSHTTFLKEICWRDFSAYLLYHFPDLATKNWRADFDAFPWLEDEASRTAWQKGQTGYPIVDAGMRELWATGWMHNRVRMIVASFLIKHLMLDWRAGEAWFWDTLVDADPATNPASWQWVAGSGADASPYFRIFNPIAQAEKFDPEGNYIRKWVPELARMPSEFIAKPWEASPLILHAAEVELGTTYPKPLVDHRLARERALSAFATLKKDPSQCA